MTGEHDLGVLVRTMAPELAPGEFVFLSFPDARPGDHTDLEAIVAVVEDEGLTLVVPRTEADERGLAYSTPLRKITLQVHSSLEAVGLTAAVATRLTEHGISANVVAGHFHDHIFVPSAAADRAVVALRDLSAGRP